MSSALAIASVTETLVTLLTQYIDLAQVSGASVSAVTPDLKDQVALPGVNVFLYQVTPNPALRNADLPTRAADGSLLQKPQAALDLHYLLTFYGEDRYLEQQRLLGATALTLHRFPVLPRTLIQPAPINNLGATTLSGLETQSQLVRFTPITYSLEELSKLWSFLLKVDYVLSTAYVASVVLMDAGDPTPPPALPVLSRRLRVLPMQAPVISQVAALVNGAPSPGAPITMATDIALIGSNLAAPSGGATQVLIGGVTQPPASISAREITLALPSGLAAGAQTVQVSQPLMLGSPRVLHPGTGPTSAPAAFVLSPMIAPGAGPGGLAITLLPDEGSPPEPALEVGVVPQVQAGQRAILQMLPQASPPVGGTIFDGGVQTAATGTLVVPIGGLAHGTYFVRVLVDGAMSPLTTAADGATTGPSITI
jgi:hypothetical protein